MLEIYRQVPVAWIWVRSWESPDAPPALITVCAPPFHFGEWGEVVPRCPSLMCELGAWLQWRSGKRSCAHRAAALSFSQQLKKGQ